MNDDRKQREFVVQSFSRSGDLWHVVAVPGELSRAEWCGDGVSIVLDSNGGIGRCLHLAPQLPLLVILEGSAKHFNKHCNNNNIIINNNNRLS